MSEGKLYFAYGSNINLDQMAHRCPAAEVVGSVILENYRLLFRGNRRGRGVATIAPRKGSKVHGLLWKITPECERSLDVYEGRDSGGIPAKRLARCRAGKGSGALHERSL